jgi:hypothetical protein
MRRGKLSVHISDVKKVLSSFAVEISASTLDELKEETITLLLKVFVRFILESNGCQLRPPNVTILSN